MVFSLKRMMDENSMISAFASLAVSLLVQIRFLFTLRANFQKNCVVLHIPLFQVAN